MRTLGFLVFAAGFGATACAMPTPTGLSHAALSMAKLVLCNETTVSLRLQPNWLAVFPIGPGKCETFPVPVGPTAVTVHPIARAFDWVRFPAARIDVPLTGAVARYTERDGFIDLEDVRGTTDWARCGYPAGLGPQRPPPLNVTGGWSNNGRPSGRVAQLWRDDMLRWIAHNLVCEPRPVGKVSAR